LLLQILVLTLFCPNDERSVDDGPVISAHDSGPKLVDLFTPEFCLKVGDTFVKTLRPDVANAGGASPAAVSKWLQKQRGGEQPSDDNNKQLTILVKDLVEVEQEKIVKISFETKKL
jgi:hypothetical protein